MLDCNVKRDLTEHWNVSLWGTHNNLSEESYFFWCHIHKPNQSATTASASINPTTILVDSTMLPWLINGEQVD